MNDTPWAAKEHYLSSQPLFLPTGVLEEHTYSWASGYIDGEGCFAVNVQRSSSLSSHPTLHTRYVPSFSMMVRADDKAALRLLQKVLGVRASVLVSYPPKTKTYQCRINPRASLHCSSLYDLLQIVRHLDRYPLLAKKSRDYVIWRDAVLVLTYSELSTAEKQNKLYDLRNALLEGRKFNPDASRDLNISHYKFQENFLNGEVFSTHARLS